MPEPVIEHATAQRQPGVLVYLCGVATSALVLWVTRLLAAADVNVLGWYVNGILPAGALFVGIASGAGYALASYYFNIKLTRPYVIGMLATGVFDYTVAQYLTYTSLLEQHHVSQEAYSFLKFFRDQCELMSFSRAGASGAGSPLGAFGYFFKTLEVAGFAAGVMVPSWALFKMPYCKRCQHYLKQVGQRFLFTAATRKDIFDLPRKERQAGLQEAVAELLSRTQPVAERIAHAPSLEGVKEALRELESEWRKDAAGSVTAKLKKCPTCDAHHVDLLLNHVTLDKKTASRSVAQIDRTDQTDPVGPPSAAVA